MRASKRPEAAPTKRQLSTLPYVLTFIGAGRRSAGRGRVSAANMIYYCKSGVNNIMNSYWYREYKTLAGDWALEVRRGVVPIGNIRKNGSTGRYEFFKGRDTV